MDGIKNRNLFILHFHQRPASTSPFPFQNLVRVSRRTQPPSWNLMIMRHSHYPSIQVGGMSLTLAATLRDTAPNGQMFSSQVTGD
jgi:hypothetical protein